MKPLFKKIAHSLWHDEMAARRWARGLLVGFGVTGAGAVQLAPERWRLPLFLVAGLVGCVGGLISVGEPNPKPPADPPADKGGQGTQAGVGGP